MEDFDENVTPFWLQTTENGRLRRRQYLFFNTGILVILLLAVAFAFIFVIVPSFLSFTSKIFKPQVVKKSWDSLNLVLVIFAVICAFLSKNNGGSDTNETPRSYGDYKFSSTPKHVVVDDDDRGRRSNPATSDQWYYGPSPPSDRTAYNSLRRMRNSNSYPDLRQESAWVVNGDDRWRFYDDTGLYNYRSRSRRERDEEQQVYSSNSKDIAVDTVRITSPPQPTAVPPPVVAETEPSDPPQPPKVVRRKPKRTYEDVPPRERGERKEVVYSELKTKHSLPSPPPPIAAPPSPPPPPPPPPLPSFYNIFSSKKNKGRRHHHTIPPPPPPPPSLEARASRREPNKPPVRIKKPPLPVNIRNVHNVEENIESGNESPFNSIPPPPPPPPFNMPAWKFEVHGDFVRLKSINSSRSGSPDLDDPLSREASPSDGNKTGDVDGGESTVAGTLFCPSPDVNTKADNFIARFRAGLKLEKINSVKGRSNLGLDPGPSTV
ncbi:formin-like protein 20 [Hibiscus syriacus]|uniref:formin-like protein 20 n=1 Tax=Hibiscus syriacus TaxID=106335 RepID=UPI001924BD4E|nr:formin-like protein 20 [Hibiscus syriacus]